MTIDYNPPLAQFRINLERASSAMPHAQSLNSDRSLPRCTDPTFGSPMDRAELSFGQFDLVHHAAVFKPSETWERKELDGTGWTRSKKDKKEMSSLV